MIDSDNDALAAVTSNFSASQAPSAKPDRAGLGNVLSAEESPLPECSLKHSAQLLLQHSALGDRGFLALAQHWESASLPSLQWVGHFFQ